MKPMFRVFSFTVLTSTLLFSSCVKDLYDPEVIAEKNPDAEIPVGFKFTTTKNVNLTVNVNDEYNGEKFYLVEVYNQNPLASNSKSKLLTAGVAKGNTPLVEDIVVSQSDSVLYIKQIDPLQREVVMIVDVTSATTAVCDFSSNSITTKSTASSVVSTRAIPASAERASDYKLLAGSTTLGSGAVTLAANKSYYLPEGVTNNQITFPGGQNKIELYVAGSTTFSGQFSLTEGCKIVVLPKGTVTAGADLNWYGQNIVVAIHEGGTLNLNANSSIGVNTLVINDGTLNTKNLVMGWNNPKIVNNGTLNSQDIEVTNGAAIQNNNLFNVRKLTGNSTTKLENNGEIKAAEVSLTNKFVIDNNHHMEIAYLKFGGGGGTLNNNCFTVCDDLSTEQGTINSASGSLLACKDFWGNNSTITLKGNAIFSIGDVAAYNLPTSTAVANGAVFNYHVEINGAKQSNLQPLFYIKSGSVGPTSNFSEHLSFVGSIEAAITPAYDSRLLYNSSGGNVKLTKEPQTAIAETACNGSGATEDPGTGTPTNPSFPIKVETGNEYTFAMEDNWPALGDYDMNDFVFTIENISYTKGNDNRIVAMSFEITPVAAGATNRLALGVQFDKIASGSMSLVSSTNGIGTKENGQEKANLILFPDVYSTFGVSSPGITNTDPSKTKYASKSYKFEVAFNNSVSESDINISNLNFYLIIGQNNDVNRKEVHLAGYKPTSKVKSDPLDYTDYNNMVWGLLIPTADFKYPIETIKIQDAYPNFLNWAKSGGSNNANWYLSPQSGKVYNK